MRTVVPGFAHRPGIHCASTALADALRTVGLDLSEEAVFGLGSGAGFVLFASDAFSPTRALLGRSPGYEQRLCEVLGIPFDEAPVARFDEAWRRMREHLDSGRIVLALTDLKYLPYYQTKTHFNGHRLLVAGYDDAAGTVLLADSHFPGLQEVPLSAWREALVSDFPPYTSTDCVFGAIAPPAHAPDLPRIARDSIHHSAEAMLSAEGTMGLAGIELLAETIARWSEASDWQWCARFAYQVIEKRGCGGGLFRRMYARFLQEAASSWCVSEALPLVPLAVAAADAWTSLAAALKHASEQERPDFQACAEPARDVAKAEQALWESARR